MSGEESTIRWRDDWVAFLIKCRQKHNHLFTGKKFTANNGWAIIKREMVNAGLPREVSLSQVRKKWCNLTTKYKDYKNRYDNQEQDFNPYHWQFFDIMENVLSNQTKQQIIKSSRVIKETDVKTPSNKIDSKTPAISTSMTESSTDNLQYSLSWNNFHSNLSNGFHTLLLNGDMVDVTLACDGKIIYAHKIVLSVCSPFFKEMFKGNPCKHPIVFLKEVDFEIMQGLLEFMYSGQVNVKRQDLNIFLQTAETLQVKGLTGQRKNLKTKLPNLETEPKLEQLLDNEEDKTLCTNKASTSNNCKVSKSSVKQHATKRKSQDPLDSNDELSDENYADTLKTLETNSVQKETPNDRPKLRRKVKKVYGQNDRLIEIEFIKEEPTIQMLVEEVDYDFNSLVGITDPGGNQISNSDLATIEKFTDLG